MGCGASEDNLILSEKNEIILNQTVRHWTSISREFLHRTGWTLLSNIKYKSSKDTVRDFQDDFNKSWLTVII